MAEIQPELNTRYDYATGCTGGPLPGAEALMSHYLGAFRDKTNPKAAHLGIYNCKRLGSGWSLHAEGRAADLGTAPYVHAPPWLWDYCDALRRYSGPIGVQLIIHKGKVWSALRATAGWRDHQGDPHNGHAHVELTIPAARTLTAARIEAAIGGGSQPQPVPPTTPTVPATDQLRDMLMSLATIRRGSKGELVGIWQSLLNAHGYRLAVDKDFGPKTDAATRDFQVKYRVPNSVVNGRGDGVVGIWSRAYANGYRR